MDERTLTDADVAAIASAISKQTACSLGVCRLREAGE